MTKTYNIILNTGYDQTDLYSMVTTVTDELLHRSTFFTAECTEDQVTTLKSHEAVFLCQCEEDTPEIEDAVVKQVDYHRDYNHNMMRKAAMADPHPKGNWGLIRHQSQTNNTTFSTDAYSSYSNSYIGDGVDIIMQIASVLHILDPEFINTDGISRLQSTFQLNSLTGMTDLPTVNYGSGISQPAINSHAEAVSYITAGNTYGWATGAKIYMWPRDQMNAAGKKLNTHGWDAFKLFHQQKGNSRPTIVVDAIQYIDRFGKSAGSVVFRDDLYSSIAPSGSPLTASDRVRIFNTGTQAYGNSLTPKFGGEWNIFSNVSGSTMNAKAFTDQNKADIKTYIENKTNGNYYYTYIQPVEEMISAGVHHVSAAGNFNNKIALTDNIDFNNGILTNMPIPVGSGDGQMYRPYLYHPLCRTDLHQAGDTIICASLGSQFSVDSGLSNKETLSGFSNRGDRVDACAAGENIYMSLYVNGEYEATGTSFASPNIGGMAACVLGKYPTTTPAQLRKYFRDHAVGTETLYDSGTRPTPSVNSGDASYYEDALGLRGYSGKIAYLDPALVFNPSTISNTSITSTETVSTSNKINFTVSQINTKLASI